VDAASSAVIREIMAPPLEDECFGASQALSP
jgi:hypothetical protein